MIGTQQQRHNELDELYPCWVPRTLWTQLRFTASHFPDNDFIIFEDKIYTYAQTVDETIKYARSLFTLGIAPGDHVALHMHNCPEYVFLCFALSMLGAVKIPLNPKCGLTEFCHCLEDSDADYLISNSRRFSDPRLLPPLNTIICSEKNYDDPVNTTVYTWDDFHKLSSVVEEDIVERVAAVCDNPNRMCDIIFTSGSCTRPKGVMETNDSLLRNAYGTARTRCYEFGHRAYITTPLCHVMAYVTGLLPLLIVGGTAIFQSSGKDVRHDIEMLRRYKANDIICMPSQMMKILAQNDISADSFPSLHTAMWTACPSWVWDTAREKLGLEHLTHAYGMTECAANLTMTSPTDSFDKVKNTNGRLLDAGVTGLAELNDMQMEIRICSFDSGQQLPAGEKGEIQYRGLCATQGYYKNDKANRNAFTDDGWFKSEDCGYIDEEGYLHFIQRNSEMYKINGENVSPLFVESVIAECELVNDLVCVGIPHKKYGAIGVVFLDAVDESEDTMKKIQEYCSVHLAPHQIPALYGFMKKQDWPLTKTGKIHRRQLTALADQLRDEGSLTPKP